MKYAEGLQHFTEKLTEDTKAIDILSFKTNHWEYESEYRIITEEEYYSVSGMITSIYLGIRARDDLKELVVRITPEKIPVHDTKIDQSSVTIKPDKRIN